MKNLISIIALVIVLVFASSNDVNAAGRKGYGKNKGMGLFMKKCKTKGYKPSKSKSIKFKGSKSRKSDKKVNKTIKANELKGFVKVENMFTVDFSKNNIA